MTVIFQPFPMLAGRRAQVWRHQPEFRRPRHFHQEPELNLVVRGSGSIGIGERTVRVSAGQILLFQPFQDHVLLESSPDFDLFVMALAPELWERAGHAWTGAAAGLVGLLPDECEALGARLAGLREIHDGATHEFGLAEIFRFAHARVTGAHVLTRRAVTWVGAEPNLSGGELGTRLRTAPSAISRAFHRDTGVKFVEYRSRLRLTRFVELVDRGESLSRAALGADFGSYAQCHRVFRRLLGCAPREYFAGGRLHVNEATIWQRPTT